jgi:hypothetical protein
MIEINIKKVVKVTRKMRKPTNFAELFENLIHKRLQVEQENLDKKRLCEDDEGKRKKIPQCPDENEIRQEAKAELHTHIDKALKQREARLKLAAYQRDTNRQWALITAAVEQANIHFHGLKGPEAEKMRGRASVTFIRQSLDTIKEPHHHNEGDEITARAKWLQLLCR